jgi:LuxR family maltose regulon positive regulatory protein
VPIPFVAPAKVLRPGIRREAVTRDRVVRAIAAGTAGPLTALVTPAGFGKTTALVTALEAMGTPTAWVSLAASENDPARLGAHVIAALQMLLGDVMDVPARAVLGGSDAAATVIPSIARALDEAGDAPMVLVLDDLHLVTDPRAHAWVEGLLDHLPERVALVVASRTRPPLHLARRIAAGSATLLGPDVLAFRGAEAELFLNGALGLGLTAEQLAAVEARVDGWAAGLALAAHAMTGQADRDAVLRASPRSDGDLGSYLVEEVLEALTPEMLRFLRRTSILPRLEGTLCEAVTQDPRAHELLRVARDSNLFVTPLAEGGGWVRYHPLFADLLQDQLQRTEPGLRAVLHTRASAWFEEAGLAEDAIRHAGEAGDGARAARLVHEAHADLLQGGQHATLRQIIDGLPRDRGAYGPFCTGLQALCRLLEGADPLLVSPVWDALERHRDAPGVARLVDQAAIWPFYGRLSRSVETARRAYALHRDGPPALWHSMAAMLGLALCFDGHAAEARWIVERHLDEVALPKSRAWALATLSFCAAEEGDYAEAEARGREGVAWVEATGAETALVCSVAYQALASALSGCGDQDAAAETIEHAFRVTSGLPGSLHHALTLMIRAKIRLAERARSYAAADAAQARSIVDRYPDVAALSASLATVEVAAERGGRETISGSAPTPAERRVLDLLPSGLSLAEIADRLFITRNTTKTHARNLYRRLGVQDRSSAVRVAYERGLLSPAPIVPGLVTDPVIAMSNREARHRNSGAAGGILR